MTLTSDWGQRFKWVRPDVYPLIGAISVAVCLAGYAAARHLASNPDVQLSKMKRSKGIDEEEYEKVLEQQKQHQNSGLFRAMSKISPMHTDVIPYPGRHEGETQESSRENTGTS